MADPDFDLFVIGGGSGGVRAARMAAQLGVARGAGRGRGAGRDLRERRLHSQEALQLRSPVRRRLCRKRPASAGTSRRRAWTGIGSRPTAPARSAASTACTSSCWRMPGVEIVRGWAQVIDGHTVHVRLPGGDTGFFGAAHPDRNGRHAQRAVFPRLRARRHFRQHVRPRSLSSAAAGRGRRLHRMRVRVDLQWAGRAGDPALPRRAGIARLRSAMCAISSRRKCARTGVDLRLRTDVASIAKGRARA